MSTRWYRIYQAGDPQLRVFLPNFWMKLVKCKIPQPKNVVVFHCSMEMTSHDVRNYLEKIYNVFPAHIRTTISQGKTRMCRYQKCIVKDDDVKVAFVSLKKGEEFTFPELSQPSDDELTKEKMQKETEEEYNKYIGENQIPSMPSWFRI
ncbi:mitochondrial ribosomal protein L23 [Nomia melanderi]|uniref:mitochondrial ribosomal protein L23 n=1 Tax=Nomia melanderi TaxID=2448451 RepID=UPI001303F92C|nr:39S ribosomal protein L23, mitochondrial [Nomia melanderi]